MRDTMNNEFTFAVPCLFGLEGLVGDELRRMKLDNVRVEDRRAFFTGGYDAMAKANLRLRMGEREAEISLHHRFHRHP